ncbi:hypothetical protein ACLMJK_001471 [Lecanora helva]
MASSTSQAQKTAIVTGSTQGIGKAIAIQLAKDGFDICINDIPSKQQAIDDAVTEIKAFGRKAVGIAADVSRRAEVETLVQGSAERLGPLSVMVANAGITQVKPILELTEEDVDKIFKVNFNGVFNCYQVAAKQIIKQGTKGKLIGAASITAFKPFPIAAPYSASKWAVRGLTQAFAMELGAHGITCNAYAPGIVDTAQWAYADEVMAELTGAEKGETFKKYSADALLGRASTPQDVAGVVGFLAGGASDYMTGQTIIVDGGIQFS